MKILFYPIFALAISTFAHFNPEIFTPFKGHMITLLMLIMLGMGLTLTFADFKDISGKKFPLILGVMLQFLLMPLIALGVSQIFNLSDELLIGMVLVGTSAGGTASNVITYLAKGDLALSVSMTIFSTFLAVFLMPFLTWFYIGEKVNLNAYAMLFDVFKITILPLFIGIILNTFCNKFIYKIKNIMPILSMFAIVFIIAVIISLNTQNLKSVGFSVIFAVLSHNIIGMLAGYYGSKFCGFDAKISRTIAIEVGMQNSGLSAAIAIKYFGALSALPGALFSITQNVIGAIFASFCKQK